MSSQLGQKDSQQQATTNSNLACDLLACIPHKLPAATAESSCQLVTRGVSCCLDVCLDAYTYLWLLCRTTYVANTSAVCHCMQALKPAVPATCNFQLMRQGIQAIAKLGKLPECRCASAENRVCGRDRRLQRLRAATDCLMCCHSTWCDAVGTVVVSCSCPSQRISDMLSCCSSKPVDVLPM